MPTIDQAALMELDESFPHSARELRRKRIRRPVPIGRSADSAQLAKNLTAGFLDEGDGAVDKCFAPEIEPGLSFLRELFLDDVLGGDTGVIGAGNPECLVPHHP